MTTAEEIKNNHSDMPSIVATAESSCELQLDLMPSEAEYYFPDGSVLYVYACIGLVKTS